MRSGWHGKTRKTMATTPSSKKRFDVIGSGFVRCNKRRWKDAKLVLFRPGYGVVSLEFMELGVGERRDERDENGNLINCKVHLTEYGPKIGEIGTDFANGESKGIGTSFTPRSQPSGYGMAPMMHSYAVTASE